MAGGQGTRGGARIGGVDGGVGQAVEGHSGGTGGDHGHDDPEQLMRAGETAGSEDSPAQSEREREDGMLPLDHLQRDAEAAEDRHQEIVKQGAGFRRPAARTLR